MVAPEVSVLMPVRDGQGFVRDAVESILNQSFEPLELLVVDDGSTDATLEILRGFSDPRLRVLASPSRGIAAALNHALSHAGAELVARMDADDVADAYRLERQVGALRRLGVGVMGSWYGVVDADGARLGTVTTACTDRQLRLDLYVRCPLGHGTILAKRDLLLQVGGYRAEAVPAEDYDLWARLAPLTTFACVPEVLYRYRLHGSNSSERARGLHPAAARVREELWSSIPPPRPGRPQLAAALRSARELSSGDRRLAMRTLALSELRFIAQATRRRLYAPALREVPATAAFVLAYAMPPWR